jgi:hypothetical protein
MSFPNHRSVAIAAGLCASVLTASAQVIPIDQAVGGQSQAQWTATWWQTMVSIPSGQNPVTDKDGSFASGGDFGEVFMLAGTTGGSVNRTITVRDDQYLFVPLINLLVSDIDGRLTETDLRDTLEFELFFVNALYAELDGAAVSDNLFGQRIDSPPGLFDITPPADNIFGFAPGTYEAVAGGYWVMLGPLSVGTHTLEFGGSRALQNGPFGYNFLVNANYTINVVPAPGGVALLAGAGLIAGRRRRS